MHHAEEFSPDHTCIDQQYFDSYADIGVHRVMLDDRPRMEFYRHIMSNPDLVRGRVVVDVGAGTGILSCWAARAGASAVFAVEASSMAAITSQIVANNNLERIVTVIASTVEELASQGAAAFAESRPHLRELGGISLIVSEWMGFYLFHEGMLNSVLRARDFFHEVNTALGHCDTPILMAPSTGSIFLSPICLQPLKNRFLEAWRDVHGVDMSTIGEVEYEACVEGASPLIEVVPSECLLHEGVLFWQGDFSLLSIEDVAVLSQQVAFQFAESPRFKEVLRKTTKGEGRGVVVDGFAIWFTVEFRDHKLSTSPLDAPTHWKQTSVLLPREFRDHGVVCFQNADETFEVHLTLSTSADSDRCYTIELELC